MSAHYTVTAAKNAGERDNPRGGKLVKWYVTLENERGESLSDVYWQRKPGNEVSVGDKVHGTVSKGEYGPRFKLESSFDGGASRPSSAASGDDPRQDSIERQVAAYSAAYVLAGQSAAEPSDVRPWFNQFLAAIQGGSVEQVASEAGLKDK